MSKKVSIITICDNNNYGNRLQNYALSKILNDLGIMNVTIWDKSENTFSKKIKFILKKIVPTKNLNIKRYVKFKEFTDQNIKNLYFDLNELYQLNKNYDYFIVGSDQIWNYNFGHAKEKDFLKFAEYDKTISYAPSFGISEIDNEWKNKIREGINHMKYISVREHQGAHIIKELTDREASVVLDPTLLLDKREWQKIEKKPKNITTKKYILTYFLGEKSKQLESEINVIKEKSNLEVINLCDIRDEKYYICGPSEFLYLFNNAEMVLTDSFHACVFSLIFEKPFYVFDRNSKGIKNMSSRIDTLLTTFGQEQRKVISLNGIENLFTCDYSKSYEVLKVKKEESINFLKNSLSI